jgi:hypothetical protein
MADYIEEFSAEISNASREGIEWLVKISKELDAAYRDQEDERTPKEVQEVMDEQGWVLEELYPPIYDTLDSPCLRFWFHTDDTGGAVFTAAVMQAYLRKFWPDGCLGFSVAETCTRPRLDGFGGHAYFITSKEIRVKSLSCWLYNQEQKHQESRNTDTEE